MGGAAYVPAPKQQRKIVEEKVLIDVIVWTLIPLIITIITIVILGSMILLIN